MVYNWEYRNIHHSQRIRDNLTVNAVLPYNNYWKRFSRRFFGGADEYENCRASKGLLRFCLHVFPIFFLFKLKTGKLSRGWRHQKYPPNFKICASYFIYRILCNYKNHKAESKLFHHSYLRLIYIPLLQVFFFKKSYNIFSNFAPNNFFDDRKCFFKILWRRLHLAAKCGPEYRQKPYYKETKLRCRHLTTKRPNL